MKEAININSHIISSKNIKELTFYCTWCSNQTRETIELQNNIKLKNKCKNSYQNISKCILEIYKKDNIFQSNVVHHQNERLIQHSKLKVIYHSNQLKDKNIWSYFIKRHLKKLMFINDKNSQLIKNTQERLQKSTGRIILSGVKLNAKTGNQKSWLFSSSLLNIIPNFQRNKVRPYWKEYRLEKIKPSLLRQPDCLCRQSQRIYHKNFS